MRPDVPDASILFQKARTKLPPLQGLQRQMLRPRVVNESNSRTALKHVAPASSRRPRPAPLFSRQRGLVFNLLAIAGVCVSHAQGADTADTARGARLVLHCFFALLASLHCLFHSILRACSTRTQ
jgi:hypothetical protein